jgi:acyl carrier protein
MTGDDQTVGGADRGASSGREDDLVTLLATIRALAVELHPGLPTADIGPDSRFDTDIGLDSLSILELRDRLEAEFKVTIPDSIFAEGLTPRDWLHILGETSPEQPVAAPTDLERKDVMESPLSAPAGANTLLDVLEFWARADPERVHLRLLHYPDSSSVKRDLTYGELWASATAVAGCLGARGLRPGDRVALMLPTMPEYFGIFLGVMLAGAIPVPIYPPARASEIEEHMRRQVRILANAGARFLIVPPAAARLAHVVRATVSSLDEVLVPADLETGPVGSRPGSIRRDEIALLQYTSGSTGDPKGVILTHADLLTNIASMGEAAQVGVEDVFVSWLPLYHDMGLIAAWLTGLHYGYRVVIMAPTAFLARPERWLRALHSERGTLSAAPNFAYEYCAALRDDQLDGLDLSSWRLAFCGSEPVRPATITRFCECLEPYGFKREAMTPAYGMAEAGVGVTFSPPGRGPLIDAVVRRELLERSLATKAETADGDRLEFVSCGSPLPGYEVRILGVDGEILPERHEGRVEFSGPSATRGYYHNEAATVELVHGRWLETGDLGYLAAGELYLTGRSKDVIIRAGQNIHPEELEVAVGSLPKMIPGRVAVFASADRERGTERLVVMAETAAEGEEARSAIRKRVTETSVRLLGTPPDEIVLVQPGTVVLTASGKLARSASRDRYERGELSRTKAPPWLQLVRIGRAGVRSELSAKWTRAGQLVYGSYALAVTVLVAAACWPFVVLLPIPQRSRYAFVRAAGTVLRRALGVPLTVTGSVPDGGPIVVIANHASFVDGLVLILTVRQPMRILVGGVFARQPLIGRFLSRLGCVFTEGSSPADAVAFTDRLAGVLRSGQRVASFPEGGLESTPELGTFHLGAFRAAASADVPVVPIGISGTRSIVARGERFPRRGAIHVAIGAPIASTGTDWRSLVALRDGVQRAVASLLDESSSGLRP